MVVAAESLGGGLGSREVGCARFDYGGHTEAPIRRDGSAGPVVAVAGSDRRWPDRVRDLFVRGRGDGVRLPVHGGGARYLSPFYSPDLKSWGLHISFTYAFFVIWVPLGFRLTCYYYRKAYYRAFFLAPPGCAVAGLNRGRYRGETRFPFILMNLHRFFFYIATIVLVLLWYDAVRAFFFRGSDGSLHLGVGLGSLIMLANVVLLSMFTFGCNSFRHLVGGKLDCFSCSAAARTRHKLWRGVGGVEWAAHAVGLDQPRWSRADRPLPKARFSGCLPRPEDLLNPAAADRARVR